MKFDRVTRLIVICTLGLFLTFGTASCAFMESLVADKVVTTEDNVKDEYKDIAIPAPTNVLIPEEARIKLDQTGKKIVLVEKEAVKDPTKAVEVLNPNADALGTIIDIGLGAANILWPGIAALEGLGLLVSRRKRQHYVTAVKAVNPLERRKPLTRK
jgi:hypothetical protein